MIIKQLSIFLNNKIGRFADVIRILASENINLQAFTVSESSDFGILRLIVDDADRATAVLRDASFAVSQTDVVLIETPDTPGSLSPAIDMLTNAGISIEYMYAFSSNNRAKVVIRTNDIARCEELLLSIQD
ncbi:MAG: amino acid-binding protein [Prevotella sp.]|jgi:hypothetical protein|nr:amino acid-binding protein [Prevotella sp.]